MRVVISLLGLSLLLLGARGRVGEGEGGGDQLLEEEEDKPDLDLEVDESGRVVASRGDDEFDIIYSTPKIEGDYNFAEHFDNVEDSKRKWIVSKAQKEEEDDVFKYEGKWDFEFPMARIFPMDKALVMKSKAKLHAISAKLNKPFEFKDKPLILQYEVNFQNGMDCGGAYVKLLTHSKDLDLNTFNDKTPYTIMFGPDKCGSDMKIHFIFRHKNPLNGTFSEKHSKRPSNRVEETYGDKKPHLYRLKLTPDNRFEVFVDDRLINSGSLLDDMEPSVNPSMEIEDPNAKKPADWDEREKIQDPTASKPEDWDDDAPMKIPDPDAQPPAGWLMDEPEMVPDPTAQKPEDWDEGMDGSWEAPLINNPNCATAPGCGKWTPPIIDNPKFKGKWKAPMMSNPNYKGKWVAPKIPNPDYFEDKEPFKMTPIGAVGLELWTMSDQVLFDNFIISSEQSVIDDWTSKTWQLKRRVLDKDSEGVFHRLLNYTNAHPWLWAVYVIVIALPVVLIFAFCCGSSQEKKIETHFKKTDEPLPDDRSRVEDVAEEDDVIPRPSRDDEASTTRHRNRPIHRPETDEDGSRRGGRAFSQADMEEDTGDIPPPTRQTGRGEGDSGQTLLERSMGEHEHEAEEAEEVARQSQSESDQEAPPPPPQPAPVAKRRHKGRLKD